MIYVGDGPTDIPCFSAVQSNGGKTIGILKHTKRGDCYSWHQTCIGNCKRRKNYSGSLSPRLFRELWSLRYSETRNWKNRARHFRCIQEREVTAIEALLISKFERMLKAVVSFLYI